LSNPSKAFAVKVFAFYSSVINFLEERKFCSLILRQRVNQEYFLPARAIARKIDKFHSVHCGLRFGYGLLIHPTIGSR